MNKSDSCQCCCCIGIDAAATRALDVVPAADAPDFANADAAGAGLQLAVCCPSLPLLLSVLSAVSEAAL